MTPLSVFFLVVILLFGFIIARLVWHIWFSQFYDNPADLPLGEHTEERDV